MCSTVHQGKTHDEEEVASLLRFIFTDKPAVIINTQRVKLRRIARSLWILRSLPLPPSKTGADGIFRPVPASYGIWYTNITHNHPIQYKELHSKKQQVRTIGSVCWSIGSKNAATSKHAMAKVGHGIAIYCNHRSVLKTDATKGMSSLSLSCITRKLSTSIRRMIGRSKTFNNNNNQLHPTFGTRAILTRRSRRLLINSCILLHFWKGAVSENLQILTCNYTVTTSSVWQSMGRLRLWCRQHWFHQKSKSL